MNAPDHDLPEFPPEADWLAATPLQVGDEFVGRTLARLRDCGLLREDERKQQDDRALARLDLPRDVIDAAQLPEPSPTFVDSVMAEWRQERDEPLRRILPHYRVPMPSAEFVERTLRALRPPPRPRLRLLPALVPVALAAAALVWILVGQLDDRSSPELAVAQSVAQGATAEGPLLLGALVAASEFHGDELPIPPTPSSLVFAAEGGR